MKGTRIDPFGLAGSSSYWTNGAVVRIKGRPGFERITSYYVQQYIKKVKEAIKTVLNKKLPATIKSFMDIDGFGGIENIPFDTGNLHDSMVATIVTRDSNGSYKLTQNRVFKTPQYATEPQHWGYELGGNERHLVTNEHGGGMYYRGWGRDYIKNYAEIMNDPDEENAILIDGDIVVTLEAAIPYANMLNEEGLHFGWFDDLSNLLIQRIRTQVGLITAEEIVSEPGLQETGLRSHLAFDA